MGGNGDMLNVAQTGAVVCLVVVAVATETEADSAHDEDNQHKGNQDG